MPAREVPVEVSARHVPLSPEHRVQLFGAGHQLRARRPISQPGQFAAEETVEVVGPKGSLSGRVIGPTRRETQVELAASDCRRIGLPAAVRLSGNLTGSPGALLRGPAGEVQLAQGVIVAQRHLHVSPAEAAALGIGDGDVISIAVSGTRPVSFHQVVVRAREGSDAASFMVDTDEANAGGLAGGEPGTIVPG